MKKWLEVLVLAWFLICSAKGVSALEIAMDFDNNGTLDSSAREKLWANHPSALGVFVPYLSNNAGNDSPYIELRLTLFVSDAQDLHSPMEFLMGSDEVSLWIPLGNGTMKCLFQPAITEPEVPVTVSAVSEESKPKTDTKQEQGEKLPWYNWKKYLPVDANIEEADIPIENEILQEPDVHHPSFQCTLKDLGCKLGSNTVSLYLRAERECRVPTYVHSMQLKRPTRQLEVRWPRKNTTETAVAPYIVGSADTYYSHLLKEEIYSIVHAAHCVYYIPQKGNDPVPLEFLPSQYGLALLNDTELLELGFTQEDLKLFQEKESDGFRVHLYKDWIHDKYYLTFKGTDFKLSMVEDVAEDILISAGRTSPYLRKALLCGYVARKVFAKNPDHIVIVGHSLGGALACSAGIVSGFPTICINALGVSPEALENTLGDYHEITHEDDAFYLHCKKVCKAMDTRNIRYIHTQWDLLSLSCKKINGPMYLKNGKEIDILPNPPGTPFLLNGLPCDQLTCSCNSQIEEKDGDKVLVDTICLLDGAVKYCGKQQQSKKTGQFTSFLTQSKNATFLTWNSSKILSRIRLSSQCHSLNEVLYGLLTLENASSVFGKIQAEE